MIGASILQFEDLQELCKPGEKPLLSTVETWARKHHIRYQYDAKGGIWTTTEALNTALGISSAANDTATYSTHEVF